MLKDKAYHESAIEYNQKLADFASDLAETIPHEEVQRWCNAVAKQHQFHAGRHRSALEKLEKKDAGEVEVNRDAGTGKFVSDEYAEANPGTTETESVDLTPDDDVDADVTEVNEVHEAEPLDAEPVEVGVDATQDAEPVQVAPDAVQAAPAVDAAVGTALGDGCYGEHSPATNSDCAFAPQGEGI